MELKSCPFCPDGGESKLVDGCYSADGRMDKAWRVRCLKCYATVEKMPEYGEKNYWWRHPKEGIEHMREVITKMWNTRYEPTISMEKAKDEICGYICGDGWDADGRSADIIEIIASMCGVKVVE